MKNIFFLIFLFYISITEAQNTRNDNYASFGIVTSFREIPYGVSFYNIEKDEDFGFFIELKFNRLSFDNHYSFEGLPVASDTLRNALYMGNKNMIKMINIGTVINPQESGIMKWDFADIDFCIGIGYLQNFHYKFYNDTNRIPPGTIDGNGNTHSSDSLGKYYVIDNNRHGVNLKIGTNLSFQNIPFLIHFGLDFNPMVFSLGFNWKIK